MRHVKSIIALCGPIFLGLAGAPVQGLAAVATPNLKSVETIENLAVFPSPRGVTWFLPQALKVDLDCAPFTSTQGKSSCILRVFNRLDENAEAAMERYGRATSAQLSALNPIYPGVIVSVDEEFSGLPDLRMEEMKLRTVAMSMTTPYASVAVRDEKTRLLELSNRFAAGESIGQFRSTVRLKGESIEGYIAIRSPRKMMAELGALAVSGRELTEILDRAIEKGGLVVYGIDSAEARLFARFALRSEVARIGTDGRYRFQETERISRLGVDEALVLVEESAPAEATCVTTLKLERGARSAVECRLSALASEETL